MLLEGLHIPLTTPFHPDGRLNLPKLAANVVRYSKSPAAGLVVLGPSGEPTLLTDDETHEVLRVAVQAAAPEKILIAGISRDSVHATLELARFAAELSYGTLFIPFTGACDPTVAAQLAEALARDQGEPVWSLRLDRHDKDDTCWLHANAWCFSTREPDKVQT